MRLPKGSEWTMAKPTEEDSWKRYWLYFSNPPDPDHTKKILFAEIVPSACLCFREKYNLQIKHEYVFVIDLGYETETAVSFDDKNLICWQEIKKPTEPIFIKGEEK